jgi:hypothetical protein
MTDMSVKYRGYYLEFQEHNDNWKVDMGDGGEYKSPDIKKVRKRVDTFLKLKIKGTLVIKRRSFGMTSAGSPFEAVKITSVGEGGEVWVVGVKSGNREKLYSGDPLYENSKVNKLKMAEMLKLQKNKEVLSSQIRGLKEKLVRFDPETLIGKKAVKKDD